MTIEELYQWAKANECTDYEINIECYDEACRGMVKPRLVFYLQYLRRKDRRCSRLPCQQ